MDDIVAVAVRLSSGRRRYFLTWGRTQSAVDATEIEALILRNAGAFDLRGKAIQARLCATLQEASTQPYFYEAFFMMCAKGLPSAGRQSAKWKGRIARLMRKGKEIYYLGNPD